MRNTSLAILLLATIATEARASFMLDLSSVTNNGTTSTYLYTINASSAPLAGEKTSLAALQGFVSATSAPGFEVTTQPVFNVTNLTLTDLGGTDPAGVVLTIVSTDQTPGPILAFDFAPGAGQGTPYLTSGPGTSGQAGPVPEPTSFILATIGLGMLATIGRRNLH
jgi:hypothetical protein